MPVLHPPTPRLLAGPHNHRLGPAIHAFNLPAEPAVCVGASPLCARVCYAKAFLFQLQRERHRRHHEQSRDDRFVAAVSPRSAASRSAPSGSTPRATLIPPPTSPAGPASPSPAPEPPSSPTPAAGATRRSCRRWPSWQSCPTSGSGSARTATPADLRRCRGCGGRISWTSANRNRPCRPTPTWSSASPGPAAPGSPRPTNAPPNGCMGCWSVPRSRASPDRWRSPVPVAASAFDPVRTDRVARVTNQDEFPCGFDRAS